MKWRSTLQWALVGFYLLLWVGGVASYIVYGAPPEDARWTAPVFLLLAMLIVLVATRRRRLPAIALIALAGFVSELLGVETGLVFSPYVYTDALAPRVLGVPIVMTCAWTVLVLYVRQVTRLFSVGRVAGALVGALWMTAIDLVIDPLAAGRLGYWRWENPGLYYGIPLHNFAGWLVVSFLILVALPPRIERSLAAAATGWSIVLFFSIIALATGLTIPGMIGAMLCVQHAILALTGGDSVDSRGDDRRRQASPAQP
jgi:uncharacterized membrane protein